MTYGFTIHLKRITELTDELADRLYDAGCDDATPVSRDGRAYLVFDRESQSLEQAILTAIADIRSADLTPGRLELDPAALQA